MSAQERHVSTPTTYADQPFVAVEETPEMVRGTFCLPRTMAAAQYLRALGSQSAPQVKVPPVVAVGTEMPEGEPPFLSVVVRTQGKRIEELSDVLLCLSAQRDRDFEVLVVGHRVDAAHEGGLMELLRSFPPALTERMRYCAVDYGTRTTPLRVGFAAARGRYVTVLDDDDLVMDTWTESFKRLAEQHDGKMLHTFVVTQKWGTRSTDAVDHRELYAEDGFGDEYCHEFDIPSQFSVNACPLMGLAFPRFAFACLGIDFDETLTTTEDWDFLMRVYSACGVASGDTVTSVYRLWTNAESSHTVHTAREWDKNYKKIVDKMNASPFLLDTGDVEEVRVKNPHTSVSRASLVQSAFLAVYAEEDAERNLWGDAINLHLGKADKVEDAVLLRPLLGDEEWDITFACDGGQAVSTLVFSPLRAPFKVLGEFRLRMVESSGTEHVLDFADCSAHNGYQVDCNHIVFLKDSPFVAFALPQPLRLQRVDLSFDLMATVADYYIDQVTLGNYGLKLGRARRWLSRRIRHND